MYLLFKITKWTCTLYIYYELGPFQSDVKIGEKLAYLNQNTLVTLDESITSMSEENGSIFVNNHTYLLKKVSTSSMVDED